jgi:hypothetical protein
MAIESPPTGQSASSSEIIDQSPSTGGSLGRDQVDTALLLLGFLLLILSLLGAYLQRPSNDPKPSRTGWLLQPPERNSFLKYPTISSNLIGVHFVGPKRGWAVGSDGTILHTIDGGQSWQPQSGSTNDG